jgi:hypothetical protein
MANAVKTAKYDFEIIVKCNIGKWLRQNNRYRMLN